MAGKSTISITFKLDGDAKGFKELTKGADGLKAALQNTISEAKQLKGNVINFAALATGFNAIKQSVSDLHAFMGNLSADYKTSVVNEVKLATVMRQRMEATDEDVEAIKRLALAQRDLGVVDDDVQIAGAQQISTFLKQKSSLETLLPAMNNLIAQQKGMDATGQDAVNVGNMMGKVLMGQTSALKRVGISFSEAEENVLKYGTESEKAAMLAQVITNNVGEMNAELGRQPIAKTQDLSFWFGDVKDKIAELVNGAEPFLEIGAQAGMAASGVGTLAAGVKTLSAAMTTNLKTFALSTAAYVRNKAAMLASAVAAKAVTAATALWTGAQKLLNMVLTMNPIGMVITAVGTLTAGVIYAYNHFEGFRKACMSVWEVVEPLANSIMNGLNKALGWLVDKARQAWAWLSNLIGLGGKKAEITVDVKSKKSDEIKKLEEKYKNYKPNTVSTGMTTSTPAQKAEEPKEYNAHAKTLKEIEDNIAILDAKIRNSSKEQAALLNPLKKEWEDEAEAIRNAGLAIDETTGKIEENSVAFDANAHTLQGIEDNISVLQERLKSATIDEAALINRQIKAWNEKANAIRNAGIEAKEEGESIGTSMMRGWQGVKGIGGSIEGLTDSIKGNGNAWQRLVGIVDGFIGLYQSISAVSGVIQLLTGLSWGHTAAKTAEGIAETGAAGATTAAASENVTAAGTQIAANKAATASFKQLAAAQYMAAHAYIPFIGYGIGAGFVAAMEALVTAAGVPLLAKGGIASGPTLAMVGEYGGAASNPEVIAPLDKLRKLIGTNDGGGMNGTVEFKIEGRNLVGILNKENNIRRRS